MAGVETVTSDDLESKVLRAHGPVVLDFYQASCRPVMCWNHGWNASRRDIEDGSLCFASTLTVMWRWLNDFR